MKLLLINPPDTGAINPEMDPPFNLLMLAKCLEPSVDVDIAEWSVSMPDEIPCADVYGITVTTPTYNSSKKIADMIREQYPESAIIAGGSHAQFMPIDFADIVFRGNCLYDFSDLLDGTGYHLCTSGNINNGYPLPFHKIDMDKYIGNRRVPGADKCLSIISSIGCQFKCAFCYNRYLKQVQPVETQMLRDTYLYMNSNYGVDSLNIMDDNFLSFTELWHEVSKLGIKWRASGSVNILKSINMKELASSGCSMVFIGAESGSDAILERMNKQQTTDEIIDVVHKLHDNGIECRATFIVGYPGETWSTVDETATIMEEVGSISVHLFTPFPGNDVWFNPEKYGIKWLSNNYDHYRSHPHANTGQLTPAFETETLTSQVLHDMYYYLQEVRSTISE